MILNINCWNQAALGQMFACLSHDKSTVRLHNSLGGIIFSQTGGIYKLYPSVPVGSSGLVVMGGDSGPAPDARWILNISFLLMFEKYENK